MMKNIYVFLFLITSTLMVACNQNSTTFKKQIVSIDSLLLITDEMEQSFREIDLYDADSIIKDIDSFMLLLNEKNKDSVVFSHVSLVNNYSCFSSKYKKFKKYEQSLKNDLQKNKVQLSSLKKDIINNRLGWYADSLKLSLDSTIVMSLQNEEMYFKLFQSKYSKRVKSLLFCHDKYYSNKDSLWSLFEKQM